MLGRLLLAIFVHTLLSLLFLLHCSINELFRIIFTHLWLLLVLFIIFLFILVFIFFRFPILFFLFIFTFLFLLLIIIIISLILLQSFTEYKIVSCFVVRGVIAQSLTICFNCFSIHFPRLTYNTNIMIYFSLTHFIRFHRTCFLIKFDRLRRLVLHHQSTT